MRNIGPAGPVQGPPTVVGCPPRDSLRSIYPWFVLFGLLLLRRRNRNRRAWAILLPLLAIYGILHVAENRADGSMAWYIGLYIRSFAYEAVRALAVGLALLLAVSDLIRARSRLVRLPLAFAIVLIGGMAAILPNTPVTLTTPVLVIAFAAIVSISALSLGIIAGLLRWLLGRHDARWHAGIYLALGVVPIAIVESVRLFRGSQAVLSVMHQIIMATAVSQILFTPYFVFFCFALLALLSPLYRQRLTDCFGRSAATPSGTQP